MPDINLDFGYGGTGTPGNGAAADATDLDNNQLDNGGLANIDNVNGNLTPPPSNEPPAINPDGSKDNPSNNNNDNNNNNNDNNDKNDNDVTYKEGTVIAIGEDEYTIDDKGNLVDKDGNIYKEAKDVSDFLKDYEVENDSKELDINAIIKETGITIVDENNKLIEFDNSPKGVSSYINAVVEQKQDEFAQAGINSLIETYPFVSDVINYYVANGNSLKGFGEIRDLSNITIDDNNISQQEAIIRERLNELGRKADSEDYINYLKSSGKLLDVAKSCLQEMIDDDNKAKEETAKEAKRIAEQRQKENDEYWKGVKDVIDSKKICGYKIPDTIIINKNGKKIAATANDFFNYIYQVDENGCSRYVNELNTLTPEQKRDDQILRAYLRFTGGSYADLVNMAIKEEEVQKLRIKAVDRTKPRVRITPPTVNKDKTVNSDFGY